MSELKRIILHWTAGQHEPNRVDLLHYHFCVSNKGTVSIGRYSPKDNRNLTNGRYAAHAKLLNRGAIGVALCGMMGAKSNEEPGLFPITGKQLEASFKLLADLCKQYNISPDEVYTHSEADLKFNKLDNRKIDINFLPCKPKLTREEIGDFIRGKVKWYLGKGIKKV